MLDLERLTHKPIGASCIPLHHADMITGSKNDRIALGGVQEIRFLGKDFTRAVRFLQVVHTPRTTAIAGLRRKFPAVAGCVKYSLGNACSLLSMHQMARQVDVESSLAVTAIALFEVHSAQKIENIADGHAAF